MRDAIRSILLPVLLLQVFHTCWAQSEATSIGPVQVPYLDREIPGMAPLPDDPDDAPSPDRSGWPRYLRMEGRAGTAPFDANQRLSIGYGIYGLLETPNHGTLLIDGTYAPPNGGGTVTLRQRFMPLDGGWLTSNEMGVISPPVPDIARQPSRVFLPYSLQMGMSTSWENPGLGLQWMASLGEPGQLALQPASGFRKLPGQRMAIAGAWSPGDKLNSQSPTMGWTFAVRHENGRRVSVLDAPIQPTDFVDAQSTLLVLQHQDATHRLRGQAMTTQSSRYGGSRQGFWFDGEWSDGPLTHNASVYHLQPDLNWANLPMANDLMGASVRSAWRTRQWSAEGSIDWIDSVTGRQGQGLYATGSARWRLNRDHTIGAGAAVRSYGGKAWNSYLDWRIRNDWGNSGFRLEATREGKNANSHGLLWDQEWQMPQSWTLGTSLGIRTYRDDLVAATYSAWTAALSFSTPLTSRSSLRGNLSSEQSNQSHTRYGLNVGIAGAV